MFQGRLGLKTLASGLIGGALTGSLLSACAQGTAPAAPACGTPGAVRMGAGVNVERIKLLDEGKSYKVYTTVVAADERDADKGFVPKSVRDRVDMTPDGLNRTFDDIIMRSRRFKVYDMRPNVVAEYSQILVTAKVVYASQVLRDYMEGRRVSESVVKLSVQVKNMYTGENMLPADALVEGRTGSHSGDRTVITTADNVNSKDVQDRLGTDMSRALFRAFEEADLRLEGLLKPMARVVSFDNCSVDLFGGSAQGLQPGDDLVVFRTTLRQLGETTVLSNTHAIAQVHCDGVGTDTSQCVVTRTVAGEPPPKDGDYAVLTEESLKRPREQ